jgi:hypothetical protein
VAQEGKKFIATNLTAGRGRHKETKFHKDNILSIRLQKRCVNKMLKIAKKLFTITLLESGTAGSISSKFEAQNI